MQPARKYITLLLVIMVGLFLNTGFIPAPLKSAVINQVQPAEEKPVPFDDINGHWAEAAISEMYLKDIMKGYPDNTFKPNNAISKIQAVVMLVRVMGLEPNEELADDLPYLQETFHIPKWANGYVITALNEKLVFYNELETIGLQKPLARQDAARLVVRALGLSKEAETTDLDKLDIADARQIKPEYLGYVALAVEKGLMTVNMEGNFQPFNPVNRGEIAVLFSRADNFLPEHELEAVGSFVYSETEQQELALTNNDTEFTVKMAGNYLLFKDGKAVVWKDLMAGDNVKVVKNSHDEGVLILAASTPKPEAMELPFETLKLEAESEAVQSFVTKNKVAEDCFVLKQDGYLYVLVTRGEKPSSGYSVEITKITGIDRNNTRELEVTVVKSGPKPGYFYNPVLSYRFALAKISLDGKTPGQVTFVDEAGQILKQLP